MCAWFAGRCDDTENDSDNCVVFLASLTPLNGDIWRAMVWNHRRDFGCQVRRTACCSRAEARMSLESLWGSSKLECLGSSLSAGTVYLFGGNHFHSNLYIVSCTQVIIRTLLCSFPTLCMSLVILLLATHKYIVAMARKHKYINKPRLHMSSIRFHQCTSSLPISILGQVETVRHT